MMEKNLLIREVIEYEVHAWRGEGEEEERTQHHNITKGT